MATAPAPLPPSTANWHWKNKNVTAWSREWFERELLSISITGDNEGEIVSITDVTDVSGDAELGQRKSKLITIYDTKISLKWAGTASDGTEVNGSLTIPEVSHEITLDGLSDYAYNWALATTSSAAVDALFELAKTRLPPLLEAKFTEFPKAIINTHGKDLTVIAERSRAATPAANEASSTADKFKASGAADQVKPVQKPPASISTQSVEVEANFQASADDLFSLFTDEKRIPAWSRAPAQSNPAPGASYSLFGGGVKGRYLSLTQPKEIVQTWELQSPTWPAGHFATLTTTLNQSSDSTKVTFTLAGVPVGMGDEIKRNLEGYYIHGLRSIGYVQLVPSVPVYSSSKHTKPAKRENLKGSGTYITAAILAGLVLAAALSMPYFSSSPVPSK